jgi:hypothetical protein
MEKSIVKVVCPACHEEMTAVAWDGYVKPGYCAVKKVVVEPLMVLEK